MPQPTPPADGTADRAPDETPGRPTAPWPAPAAAAPAAAGPVRPRRGAVVAGVVVTALLAVLGLTALGLGVAARTVWLPSATVSATAVTGAADDGTRVLVTAPGVLETRPGPVTVTATAADRPVTLVLAREVDAAAWLDGVPTTVVGGLEEPAEGEAATSLAVTPPATPDAGEAALPEPATSDLWTQVATGEGSASFELAPPEGRWVVLAATDGTAPAPDELTLTWPQEQVAGPEAAPLVAGGVAALVLALVLAVVTALAARRRRRAPAAAAPEETR